MMNSTRVSSLHQQHTSVGGWVAATRPYPLLEEDEEGDAGEGDKGEIESEEMLSDDGGIDVDDAGGLDNVCMDPQLAISPTSTNQKPCFATPRIDSYRFSMATLEDSQDVELDAILGELCALENQFDREIFSGSRNHQRSASSVSQSSGVSSLDSRSNGQQVHHLMASTSTLQSLGVPFQHGSGDGGGGGGSLTPSNSADRFSMHSRSNSTGANPTTTTIMRTTPKFELLSLADSVAPASSAVASASSSSVGLLEDGCNGRVIGSQKAAGELGLRTESPDNDSAFSDTVSMLSSESSASSGGGAVNGVTRIAGLNVATTAAAATASHAKSSNSSATQLNAEQASRIKAEKIKIALEKIREASIKKLFIKAFTVDGSAKSLLVDEKMTVGFVTKLLVDKNHVQVDLRWSVVEHIPELFMERVFEDHENLVENLMLWTRDSKNKLLFLEKVHKYDLFVRPENYFLLNSGRKCQDFDDDSRQSLIEELFSGNCVSVPEVEGNLYMKSDGKKAWKKYFFVLRASGLYYCPKGKSKLSKDLVCLVTFDINHLYLAVGWKKKYKAPTEFGFALKHPQIQLKASKYIKYLCAEDECSLRMWTVGIRVAKFGRQLLDNHRTLLQDMAEDDLEALAHARSFSVSSVARGSGTSSLCTTPSVPTTPTYDPLTEPLPRVPSSMSGDGSSSNSETHSSSATPVSTLERAWKSRRSMSRHDSVRSSSSGATSERSGNGTPTNGDQPPFGFDCDYPTMGTIKRKPSVNPKIPLTNTTRTLAKQSIDGEITSPDGDELLPRGGGGGGGTLRKKKTTTLRRSLTDERISIPELMSTLRRQQSLLRHEIIPSPPSSPIPQLSSSSSSPKLHRQCELLLMDGGFPLPPPPPEFAASMESLLSVDCLPLPPPPDPYKSNLSLDSLPPPPPTPPVERRRSITSLNPLPLPPPSPLLDSAAAVRGGCPSGPPVPPPKPVHRPCPLDDVHLYDVVAPSPPASVAQHVPPPFLAELKAQTMSAPRGGGGVGGGSEKEKTKIVASATSQMNGHHRHMNGHEAGGQKRLKSPSVCRKITFRDEVSVIGGRSSLITAKVKPPAPPPLPSAAPLRAPVGTPDKPAPPRRNETTRLSIGRGNNNNSNYSTLALNSQVGKSPKTFLADLQKVMEKKWKVAQQLKVDSNSSPHTVMGFRDPPLPSDVLCCTAHIDEKHRVAAAKAQAALNAAGSATTPSTATTPIKMPLTPTTSSSSSSSSSLSSMQSTVDCCGRVVDSAKKKMPPPPPPKRSETTQLTTTAAWAQ